MAKAKEPPKPQPVENSVSVMLLFTKKGNEENCQGFYVRFAVPPKVGDKVRVDQNGIKKLKDDSMHGVRWKVKDVWHDGDIDSMNYETDQHETPLFTLSALLVPDEPTKIGAF